METSFRALSSVLSLTMRFDRFGFFFKDYKGANGFYCFSNSISLNFLRNILPIVVRGNDFKNST